jgi:hypothetical protein
MIEIEEFVDRLCRLCARTGPRRFPRKARDRGILMKSIRMTLKPEAEYSEQQLNDHLITWNREIAPEIECDHVTLRRLLIDYGELEGTSNGAWYRVGFPVRPLAFALEIDELDLAATVAAYRMEQGRRRAER